MTGFMYGRPHDMVMFGCCLDGMVAVAGYYRVYTMIHLVTAGDHW